MSNLAKRVADLPAEKRELLLLQLRKKRGGSSPPPITPQWRESSSYPLSFDQERLCYLNAQGEPDITVCNIPVALRLTGSLDVAALERSLNEIVRRHEALRTTFG